MSVRRATREELIARHEGMIATLAGFPYQSSFGVKTSPVPHLTEVKGFDHLRPITIKRLELEKHHTGSYILLRTIARPVVMAGANLVVEDIEGTAERFSLYNYLPPNVKSVEDASRIIPVGTILALKSPFFKVAADGGTVIRCENPSNVSVLPKNHSFLIDTPWFQVAAEVSKPSAKALRENGKDAFAEGDFYRALGHFAKAVETDPSDYLAASNAAQASLKLGYYHAVVYWTNKALGVKPDHDKSLLRKARAMYVLGQHDKILDVLKHPSIASTPEAKELSRKTREFLNLTVITQPVFDDEEFPTIKTPWVEIRPHPHTGNGMFAKERIPKGTLVIVERPYLTVTQAECYANITVQIDLSAKIMQRVDTTLLTKKTLQAMLAPGNEEARRIIRSLPRGALRGGVVWSKELHDVESDADVAQRVCLENNQGFELEDGPEGRVKEDGMFGNSGLWLESCRISHSCRPNCSRVAVKKTVIVQAGETIPAGAELTVTFMDQAMHLPLKERRRALFDAWGFVCECQRCVEEEAKTAPKPSSAAHGKNDAPKALPLAAKAEVPKVAAQKTAGKTGDELKKGVEKETEAEKGEQEQEGSEDSEEEDNGEGAAQEGGGDAASAAAAAAERRRRRNQKKRTRRGRNRPKQLDALCSATPL